MLSIRQLRTRELFIPRHTLFNRETFYFNTVVQLIRAWRYVQSNHKYQELNSNSSQNLI